MAATKITTSTLLRQHAPIWKVTCRNPFVGGIRDGSLPTEIFNRWLVQDRHFVDGLFPATCRLAAAAPLKDRHVLVEALRNMLDYLSWFDLALAARGLDAGAPMHPVCRAYVDFVVSLGFEPYPVALVAFWAQYRAYRDAWAWARPGASRFRSVVRNWYSPRFDRFLRDLTRAADAALAEATPRVVRRANEAVVDVARYELAFWVMAIDQPVES